MIEPAPIAKVMIGLATMEHIRRAEFMHSFMGLIKPTNSLILTVHGQSPAEARNIIIREAIKNECTHIFFMDDDMMMPQETLTKLLEHNKDVCTALYLMRSYPHFACAFDEAFPDGKCKFQFLTPETKGLIPIVNCGLGAVLVKTNIFKTFDDPWVTLGEIQKDGWCDDVALFNKIRNNGFELWCDTDVRVGHMTVITMYPMQDGSGTWYTEYRHANGNVLVPQAVPTPPLVPA